MPNGDNIYGEKAGLRRPQTNMAKTLLPPDYTLYDDKRFWKKMGGKAVRTVAMELSRGCPYKCTFCCVPMQQHQHRSSRDKYAEYAGIDKNLNNKLDPYHREKTIPQFVDEVITAKNKYKLDFIYFTDESFLSMRPERFDEFIDAYGKIKVPFFIETRAETVKAGYAKRLESVGCAGVAMGVESGSIELRKKLLKRHMPDEIIINAFKEFSNTSIRISANNIIGFPTETREDIMKTIELNKIINADSVVVNAFRPYSGTELRKICIEKGLIPKEERAEDNRAYGAFDNGALSSEELENIRKVFAMYVTFPKHRWPEIRKAEEDDRLFKNLMEEYKKRDLLTRKNRSKDNTSEKDIVTANEIFINDEESIAI